MSDVEKYPSDFSDWGSSNPEPPPDYKTATAGLATGTVVQMPVLSAEETQLVVPSAPPADVVIDQPHELDPYPPQLVSANPNTTTTTTTYITVTETDTETGSEPRSRQRSHYHDSYCPGFICCFFVPVPGPRLGPGGGGGAGCNCDCIQSCVPNCDCIPNCGALPICSCLPSCDCLPPTTACFSGGFRFSSLWGCFGCMKGGDNPVVIVIMLIVLALILVLLIALIALFFYRMGDDKAPEIAKRYRVSALVFAFVGYTILIIVGIILAVMFV